MNTAVKGKPTVIKNFVYHRNGIGGRGFFAFICDMQFVCHDGTLEEPETYLVTWFPPGGFGSKYPSDRKESGLKQWDPGYEVAFVVLTPMGPDTSQTLRGDRLIDHIKPELVKAYKSRYPED